MKLKGISGGDFVWLMIYGIVSIAYLYAFYSIFIAGAEVDVEGVEQSQGSLQASAIFNRVISSPDCISTGQAGVLDSTKFGTNALDCVYNPMLWKYAEVEYIQEEEEYSFGKEGAKDRESEEMGLNYTAKVNVKDGGELVPAELRLFFRRKPDPVLRLSEAIHVAQEEGSYVVTLDNPSKHGGSDDDYTLEIGNYELTDDSGNTLPLQGVNLEPNDDLEIDEGSSKGLELERVDDETVNYYILEE